MPKPGTALLVEARDGGEVTELALSGGTIVAIDGPAVQVYTTFTEPPFTLPPTPPPPAGIIDGALVENVTVSSRAGHGISVQGVSCLDLIGNDASAVPGIGYILDTVTLVGFTQATVTAWLTAKGNVGPPAPRFVSQFDVSAEECS
jgi:hypothetical protein